MILSFFFYFIAPLGRKYHCSIKYNFLCDVGEGSCSNGPPSSCKPGLVCGKENCLDPSGDRFHCCIIGKS